MPRLIIGADIVPTNSNQTIFEKAQMEIVDKDLRVILDRADYRIFNLEVPLTDEETPIKKCGPNLIASAKSVAGLKELGIDFVTLANNHILDQDVQGMWSTVKELENVGIAYAGVGKNPREAAKPYIAEIGDIKVGIYCCAEHEFSIVSEKAAGANPFDPLESLDHIVNLKQQCDYLVCLYHGGKEHYRYPSPNLQKTCRKIVEKGADLVVCQHTHCIGCDEKWKGGTIVYGQGNFLFDDSESEFWQTAVLAEVELADRSVSYIPILKDGNGVKLAQGEVAEKILKGMQERNREILQEGFVERQYGEFAKGMIAGYLNAFDSLMQLFVFRVINKLSGHRLGAVLAKRKILHHGKQYMNCMDCEAHRELILKGLEVSEQ